jgi:hypothetical protein
MSAASPIILPVNINLASGWAALLGAINKFVALDLSDCTDMTVFDPDYNISDGKDKIVSLVLPNKAESVEAGTSANPTFKNFSALKSVAGSKVETIRERAFSGCSSLETVSLPKATTIDKYAFSGCTSLAEISLPSATTIGEGAFQNCSHLVKVSLPSATNIGSSAFYQCTSLATLDLSSAITIGGSAFSTTGTVPLTITLDATVSELGTRLFSGVSSKPVTIQVPSNANWDDKTGDFTGAENTTGGPHWGEGFRGLGWSTNNYTSSNHTSDLNTTITVKIEYQ